MRYFISYFQPIHSFHYEGVTDAIWIKLNWIELLMVVQHERLKKVDHLMDGFHFNLLYSCSCWISVFFVIWCELLFISAIRPTLFLKMRQSWVRQVFYMFFVPVLINVCADRRAKIKGIIKAPSVGPWDLYITPFEHFRGMKRSQKWMWTREQRRERLYAEVGGG